MKRGKFITFEGGEGSGKSTQIKSAIEFLKEKGFSVVFTREPGGTEIGEEIRKILLGRRYKKIDDYCELFLFVASRAQLVKEVIKPELAKGKIVITDRFLDATICYQGYGSGLSIDFIKEINRFTPLDSKHPTGFIELKPDLTILLDVDVNEGLRRAKEKDRIEQKSFAYHQRVREGYLKLAAQEPERIKVVKVGGIKNTQSKIRRLLKKCLGFY